MQTFPAILLCANQERWLQHRKCLIAALLIIATLPISQEIWLSSIGSQCHLNLCTALILVMAPQAAPVAIFQKFILLFAPLSGPGAMLLLPLFALRAWVDRSRARLVQTVILSLAAVAQFAFFWHPAERLTVGLSTHEGFGVDPALLFSTFFVKHLLGPFLGENQATDVAKGWGDAYAAGQGIPPSSIIMSTLVLGIFAWAVYKCKSSEPKWFFMAGGLLFAASNFGALGIRAALLVVGTSERYVFAPQVLFELAVLSLAFNSKGLKKAFASGIIAWLLIIAAHEYFWTPEFYRAGTTWRSEVLKWQRDPSRKLNIWPKGWTVTLKPHEQPE